MPTLGNTDAVTGTLVPKSLVDAKGDLLVGTADDTVARLAVGTNDHVLTADSSVTAGVKWAAAAGSAWTKTVDLPLTSLTGWTAGAGTWTAEVDRIKQALSAATEYQLYRELLTQAEVIVEVECRFDTAANTTTSRVGIKLGIPTGSDPTGGPHITLLHGVSGFASNLSFERASIVGAGSTALPGGNIAVGTWMTLRLHRVGPVVTGYVNGTVVDTAELVDGTSSSNSVPRMASRFALICYAASGSFRNLKVWVPTLP